MRKQPGEEKWVRTARINITQQLLRQDAMPPLSHHHLQRSMAVEEGKGD